MILLLAMLSCSIPLSPLHVDLGALSLDRATGITLWEGLPFTGSASGIVGDLTERVRFKDGRRHGLRIQSVGEQPVSETAYVAGRRHGLSRTWFVSGAQRSEAHFERGRAQGTQRQWHETGAIFKRLNLVDGAEQGLQQAWRKNGALYANYEVRDGRAYGLRKAELCVELTEVDGAQ